MPCKIRVATHLWNKHPKFIYSAKPHVAAHYTPNTRNISTFVETKSPSFGGLLNEEFKERFSTFVEKNLMKKIIFENMENELSLEMNFK